MDERIAIIDIGSTSMRVIIVNVKANGAYKMIDQAKEYVRLSQGVSRNQLLQESDIQEAIKCLKLFKKLCDAHRARHIIAVATAATREALNREYFLDLVYKETGLQVEVITGEREAYLDYLGVVNSMDHRDFVLIDVGGGSTELVLVENRQLVASASVPMGSMVLSEKYNTNGPGSQAKMEKYVESKLSQVHWLKSVRGIPIVGVGGSARTLAKIDKHRLRHPLKGLHNYRLSPDICSEMYEKLSRMNLRQRSMVKGLDSKRVDIIVGGLAPIMGLLKLIEPPMLYTSGYGLRDGLFFEHYWARSHKTFPVVEDVLQHSVHNILLNHDQNLEHSYHVQGLAMELFDQLHEVHGISSDFRNVLQVGSALHDIGKRVSFYNHNLHSFHLTLHSTLHGLTNREKVMAAFVTALHDSDESCDIPFRNYRAVLQPGDAHIIHRLALLTEIAEILDRSESQLVRNVRAFVNGNDVKLILDLANGEAEIEYAAAERTRKAFRRLFGMNLWFM